MTNGKESQRPARWWPSRNEILKGVITKGIVALVALGVVAMTIPVYQAFRMLNDKLETLNDRMARLERPIQELAQQWVKKPEPPTPTGKTIDIRLTESWTPRGDPNTSLRYNNNTLILTVDLRGGDAYAELFLDLRTVQLPGIPRRGYAYDLAGGVLTAKVRSDGHFRGDEHRPNGIQFLVKGPDWKSLDEIWTPPSPAMSQMEVPISFTIPEDQRTISAWGISLKFTIATGSSATYKGAFFVTSVQFTPRSE